MSSIRLFILGSLDQHGEMHGHQLRLLAEEERIHLWTDISVGSLYGTMKRLASEGLIDIVRVEREGNFPERQVYEINNDGRRALSTIRQHELTTIAFRPDPFDLALTRLDPNTLDALPAAMDARLLGIQSRLSETVVLNAAALPYVSLAEKFALGHREARLRAELAWHEELIAALPEIVAEEVARTFSTGVVGSTRADNDARTDASGPAVPTQSQHPTDPPHPTNSAHHTDPQHPTHPTDAPQPTDPQHPTHPTDAPQPTDPTDTPHPTDPTERPSDHD